MCTTGNIARVGRCATSLIVAASLSGGCYQGVSLQEGSGPSGGSTTAGADDGGSDGTGGDGTDAEPIDVAPPGIRRLTNAEYINTVTDLLGQDLGLELTIAGEVRGPHGFRIGTNVSATDAEAYLDAADQIASQAVANLETFSPCTEPTDACVTQFVDEFAERAYRRPLTDEEASRLLALDQTVRDELGLGFEDRIRMLTARVLQSPQFLYLAFLGEEPDGSGFRPLTGYERASRLSYFIWKTMPDDELFAAAADDVLGDREVVRAQVERMLEDPRARNGIREFVTDWLGLSELGPLPRNETYYPENTETLQRAMAQESVRFFDHVVREDDATLDSLYTAPYTFANEELGALYGVDVEGTQHVRVDLDPAERAGLLTQSGWLTLLSTSTEGNPIARGVAFYEKFLCVELAPPENIDTSLPPFEPGTDRRERWGQHLDPACASCHQTINNMGFGFDRYDALGRYSPVFADQPVDDSGHVLLDGGTVEFNGGVELAQIVSGSVDAHDCMSEQWFRFAMSRLESEADEHTLDAIQDDFASTGDVRELIIAIATSPAFLYRTELED